MEPVLLDNGRLRVSVLPGRGAKIDSILDLSNGAEWLDRPESPAAGAAPSGFGTEAGAFAEGDAFGFDEMFPTINASGAGPDHGALWRRGWTVLEQGADLLDLELRGEDGGWFFRRRLRLRGGSLEFHYSAGNLLDRPLPALWTPHPLFPFYPETEIAVPADLRRVRQAMDGGALGRHGEVRALDETLPPLLRPALLPDGSAFKFYNADPLGEPLYTISDRRGTLTMDCTGGALPWIGFWINNGGWGGQRNIALEPATAPMDSPEQSEAFGVPASWRAGESREWGMVIRIFS